MAKSKSGERSVALVSRQPPAKSKPIKGEVLPPLPATSGRANKTRFKFTKTAIDRIPAPHPSGQQQLFWDEELPGFGMLVSGISPTKTYIAQRKLPSGKTCRITIERVNLMELDEARGEAETILAEIRKGINRKAVRRAGKTMTLQNALDTYIENKRTRKGKELGEKTKADYKSTIERNLEPWLATSLRDITREMVEERHKEIKRDIDVGKKNDGRSIKITGEATANGVMTVFSAIWNYAADHVPDGLPPLPTNPVRRLRKEGWFEVAVRDRLVEHHQFPAFYKAVDALENRTARDYLLLLLFTGLRRREASQLRWEDIDFAGRKIRIPAERTKARRKLDLPMTTLTEELLTAREGLGKDKSGYVFPANGKHGFLQEPKFFLRQVGKASGVHVSAHDLRRSYATVAESTDVSEWSLKALINHSLGSGVTERYIKMTVERLREPAQRVADKLKELCKIDTPKAKRKKKRAIAVPST